MPQATFTFPAEVSDRDESTIERDGLTLTATIHDDPDNLPPWEDEDGHGPVTDWLRREAEAGERVLSQDGGARRFYNFAEAVEIAKRDSWGPGSPEEAAEADFANLQAWCNDEWRYVGVAVTVSKAGIQLTPDYAHAVWGIESTAGDHLAYTAGELISDAMAAARAKLAELNA